MTYEKFSLMVSGFALGFAVCNLLWTIMSRRPSKQEDSSEYDAEKHSGMYP